MAIPMVTGLSVDAWGHANSCIPPYVDTLCYMVSYYVVVYYSIVYNYV